MSVYAVIMESALFYCITKTFCPETLKFLWDGFYWNPCWNRYEHRDDRVSKNKWKPFHLDINHQSRAIPEQRWMKVEVRDSVSLSHIYFPIVIGATHTNFKMFSQWTSSVASSVASDYHENNKVKDFLAQNFRLGCLSDLKKLPRIWAASSKTSLEEYIF